MKKTKTKKKKKKTANGNGGGKWIRKNRRLAIYLRDRFTCVYCLRDLHGSDARDITLDHVKVGHFAGNHHETNLITACRSCNSSRQDQPVYRFASVETRKHITRNCRRDLRPYRLLADQILLGDLNLNAHLERSK